MLAIRWDILPQTFLQDINACKVTMCCIQWDGMPLGCLQSNMLLRFDFGSDLWLKLFQNMVEIFIFG